MLGDEFMKGFVWRLFRDKWNKFALRVHIVFVLLAVAKLAMVVYLVFGLKRTMGKSLTTAEAAFFINVGIWAMVLGIMQLFFEISYIVRDSSGRNDLVHLPCISPASHPHLPRISAASRLHLGRCATRPAATTSRARAR